jgi:hypothetical protein
VNPRWLAASLFGALALTAVISIDAGSDKTISAQERTSALEASKLSILPDGGKGYSIKVRVADGGSELRITAADCARRPAGNKTCFAAELDGGLKTPGDLNRFPIADVRGTGCQLVACSVWQGEDDSSEEDSQIAVAKEAQSK